MAVTDDIVATYRGPGTVMRRLLGGERHEARVLAYLLAALIVIFVAQWPGQARAAFLDPSVPMTQRMVAGFLWEHHCVMTNGQCHVVDVDCWALERKYN